MIDLRSPDATLSEYVQRYVDLLPEWSPQLQQRMDYTLEPAAPRLPRIKPAWLSDRPCTLSPDQALDRAQGALLGLAIGDAVGTTLEFQRRDQGHVSDMVGGGPFRLAPGEWTDDTSMALCLADTYATKGKFDYATFADAMVRWYRQGENSVNGRCFDIGNVTRRALEGWEAQGVGWVGNLEASTAGNGSLIRLAPTAIFRRHSLSASWWESVTQSGVTHGAVEVQDCCKLFAAQLHLALNGADKQEALAPRVRPLRPRAMIINAGEYKHKSREQIRSSGYVVDTLEAALWAVWNTDNFRDAIVLAANLADDADSVAATAGQIAGALYGVSSMPPEWVAKVAWSQHICDLASRIFELAPPGDELDELSYDQQ